MYPSRNVIYGISKFTQHNTDALIFVVDSNDIQRIDEVRKRTGQAP